MALVKLLVKMVLKCFVSFLICIQGTAGLVGRSLSTFLLLAATSSFSS